MKCILIVLFSLGLLACSDSGQNHQFQGYVEGENAYLASPYSGVLDKLFVSRGERVKRGQTLFQLDSDPQAFEVQQASENLLQAKNLLSDLQQPRRLPEIEAIQAQIEQTTAQIELAEIRVARVQQLLKHNAITKEYERGTMENLLATPLRPLEVMTGKIVPYIIVGYLQVFLILLMAKVLFEVPMQGSVTLLLILCLPFIAANLAVGLMFSTLASNQLQAIQSATFFFLPSVLLSGFMFPFRGMPEWAQWIGNCLPLTHFLIVVRGILLKGNGFLDVWREMIPIILFTIIVMSLGIKRYRQTLD